MYSHTILLYLHKSPLIFTLFRKQQQQQQKARFRSEYFPRSLSIWVSALELKPKSSCSKAGFFNVVITDVFNWITFVLWCYPEHRKIFNCIFGLYPLYHPVLYHPLTDNQICLRYYQKFPGLGREWEWSQLKNQGSSSGIHGSSEEGGHDSRCPWVWMWKGNLIFFPW